MQYLRNLPITTKFILWFLFIALVPLAIAIYISYNSSQQALEKEVTKNILSFADNKAAQIQVYLQEKKKDLVVLSRMSDTADAFEKFDEAFDKGGVASLDYRAVEDEFRAFFSYYQRSIGYEDIFLIRSYGETVFSVKNPGLVGESYMTGRHKDSEVAKVFIKANISRDVEVSSFEQYPPGAKYSVFIAAPVFKGTKVLGIIVASMSSDVVSYLLRSYSSLGRTGETILVSQIGDQAVYISPLRFDSEAAFKRKVKIGSKNGLNIQEAVAGREGVGTYIDYRGKEVVAAWKYLRFFRWGVIVKMDTSEIFTSAQRLRNTLLKIGGGLLVLVVIMAILIARSVSGPITQLTKVSATIAGGDLSARAKVNASDEVGYLAWSFNKMTDSLVAAKANVEKHSRKLQEQKKLLEKVNKELDSFVYTASHDLRAPLRGVASFATFLEEDYKDKLTGEGQEYIQEIRKGVTRMDKLIEDLLALSRISRIQNPFEDVDINALISSVSERIKFDIDQYKVDLKIQENIPLIHCDRIKMGEVFLNLINNAIKFSSKNKKEAPRVEVGYVDSSDFHKIYVKDNGIGIDPKYHQQIFGIFKRLHTEKEYDGTGAGLSIVKKVIDDHGGKIWIESKAGSGATFWFTIPNDLKERKQEELEDIGRESESS